MDGELTMTIRIKRILAWASFVIGSLILTFFRNYEGHVVPYPWLFYLAGIVFFILGFLLLRKTPTVKENEVIEKANQLITNLKTNGHKIMIDLDSCVVKENKYFEEPDYYKNTSNLELFTAMDMIYLYHKFKTQASDNRKHQSVAIYNTVYQGKEQKFISPVIPNDRSHLLILFSIQKTTSLYIDKNNPDNYYFDMEFALK